MCKFAAIVVLPVEFLSFNDSRPMPNRPEAQADGTVIWRKVIVLLLCPFLVMWFLSAGSFSTTSDPWSWLSCELGIDCLVWKWIQLLKQAKHQIRALKLCVTSCVTITSALDPLSFCLSTGQCVDMVSAPSYSLIFILYTSAFLFLFALLNGILHWCLVTGQSLHIMKNNVMGFIVYSEGKAIVYYSTRIMIK